MKTILTAAAFALALSGAAFAQQSGGTGSSGGASSSTTTTPMAATEEGGMQFMSDDEKMMYSGDNAAKMAPFFTDNTMGTMKPDADVKAAFAAMDADSQAGMKKACTAAMENRGSYGSVTTSLCTSVMQ